MTRPPSQTTASAPKGTADADVHFWQQQSIRLERDARRLQLAPLVCLLIAALAYFLDAPSAAALGLVLLGLAIAAMAAYMVAVRRQECRQGLHEAERRSASAGARSASDAIAPPTHKELP